MTFGQLHRIGFLALSSVGISIFVITGWQPDRATQVWLLAPAVALLGVPHGALDLSVAQRAFSLRGFFANALFGLSYIALAALLVAVWVWQPGAALALFLAYSAMHFAGDWDGELPLVGRFAAGAAVIALPSLFHETEVAEVFALLVPLSAATTLAEGLQLLAVPLIVLLGAVLSLQLRTDTGSALEIASLVFLALLLPPLLFFTAYFSLLHSPRHFMKTAQLIGLSLPAAIKRALSTTLITLIGAALAAAWLSYAGTRLQDGLLQVVFIGLAALTVPHMTLSIVLNRHGTLGRSVSAFDRQG